MENLGKIGQMIKKLTDFKLTFFSLKSATFSVVVDIIYTWALVSSQKTAFTFVIFFTTSEIGGYAI